MPKATSTKLEPFKLNFLKFLASSAHIKKLNKDKFLSLSPTIFLPTKQTFIVTIKQSGKIKKNKLGNSCAHLLYTCIAELTEL